MRSNHTQRKRDFSAQRRRIWMVLALTFLLLAFLSGQLLAAQENRPVSVSTRMIAEWEPATAVMIAWPLRVPDELVTRACECGTAIGVGETRRNRNGQVAYWSTGGCRSSALRPLLR